MRGLALVLLVQDGSCLQARSARQIVAGSCLAPRSRGAWCLVDGLALGAGMFAGSAGVGIAYPLDTLKVKAQVYAAEGGAVNALATARRVQAEEGIEGFYQGVLPTMVGQALIKGVLFFAYESIRAMMQPPGV